jgi:hypothetical protein
MPVQRGRDSQGPYYKWGNRGHHYYYLAGNKRSRERAYNRALKQGRAILVRRNYSS